jgi:CrcB protein
MSQLSLYLAVMAGGAVGTALRMAISLWVADRYAPAFPLGTLVVNVVGCFVTGLFGGLTTGPNAVLLVSPILRQTVMVGVLGGFTTFSSFSLQTLALANDGEWLQAGLNVAGSVALCLVGVWLGSILATAVSGLKF